MLNVDLSLGTEGIITFRNGERWWCPNIVKETDGTYSVRYEHGWYCTYMQDGRRVTAGRIVHSDGRSEAVPPGRQRDIVEFTPCNDSVCESLKLRAEVCP